MTSVTGAAEPAPERVPVPVGGAAADPALTGPSSHAAAGPTPPGPFLEGHAHAGPPAGGQPPAGPGGVAPPVFVPSRTGRIGRAYLRLLDRIPAWVAPLAVLGCIGGAVGYTLISNPTDSAPDAPPTCVLKLTTGLDCPGCGGTRAAWYLLHGDISAAARHHLVFVFAVPFLLYLYVAWAVQRVFGRKLPPLRISPTALVVFLVAWLGFSILRNLPWAPFTWFYV